eukprot:334857-Chlamydomonas_euryale.AAC.12
MPSFKNAVRFLQRNCSCSTKNAAKAPTPEGVVVTSNCGHVSARRMEGVLRCVLQPPAGMRLRSSRVQRAAISGWVHNYNRRLFVALRQGSCWGRWRQLVAVAVPRQLPGLVAVACGCGCGCGPGLRLWCHLAHWVISAPHLCLPTSTLVPYNLYTCVCQPPAAGAQPVSPRKQLSGFSSPSFVEIACVSPRVASHHLLSFSACLAT